MDDADRDRVEALLRERADDLRKTRTRHRQDAEGMRESELSHLDNHPADTASELHEHELDVTTEMLFDEEERRFEEAKHALERGTYGVCVGCGTTIPPARLKAVPEAVRCLNCQREFEAVHRQSANGL
jgi:RNA polymerase-binding transcription factor DksA